MSFSTDDKIYTYMMELVALMACNYIETFELEMYLSLFKSNNPPLVRKFLISNVTNVRF